MPRELPYIESERLVLRLLKGTDLQAVLDFWRKNDVHLAPSGPKHADDFFTEAFWIKQIQRHIEEYNNDVSARMYLFEKSGSAIVGFLSFAAILRSAAQFCYLGYGLAEDKQKLGYMTEITPHAIKFAFEELNIHRIMANYKPSNERSGKLLKRMGFTVEGYARDYLYLNGEWQDHIMTSLTNQNWQPS